jgi:hypothetical protein
MRNVAIFASAILVSGLMAEPLNAYEMPNLSDPKVIAAVTRFSWRSNARIATVRMAPAASISPGAYSTPRAYFYRRRAREERHRMPAWREVFSDQEIWQATAYVLSISRPAH